MACYNHKQIQQFAANAGFPNIVINSKSGQVPLLALMSAISKQESNHCDSAVGTIAKGKEISVGIFQINSLVHKKHTVEELKNPNINAQEAYRIYKTQGLNAWGGYYDNRYKKYLSEALKAYNNATIPVLTNNDVTNILSNTPILPVTTNNQTVKPFTTTEIAIGATILFLLLTL